MPGAVDSNVPMTWELVDGTWQLFALTSWGGIPALLTGPALNQMRPAGPLVIVPHPGHGVWIEAVITDDSGAWYGYYHHERSAEECGRSDRFIPRIGSLKSTDRGRTWEPLGFMIEAPPDRTACGSSNRYVLGGVGDLSVMLAPNGTDLFLYFSQYSKVPSEQGVAVARLAWADRDAPAGRVTIWQEGAWVPARGVAGSGEEGSQDNAVTWEHPVATPLTRPSKPWHDGQAAADAFWGPSLHWNQYLEQYVMLLNRTRDESFTNEGIYVSYARTLNDPRAWSPPRKIMNGGGWYPQVAGTEPGTGTDRQAGQRARFLVTGRSDYYIDFQR